MINIQFTGGVRNQLFQFAFGRNLSIKFKRKVTADLSFYDTKSEQREFLMNDFCTGDNLGTINNFTKRRNDFTYKIRITLSNILLKTLRWGSREDRLNRLYKINASLLGLYIYPPKDLNSFKIYKSFFNQIYVLGNYISEDYFKENKEVFLKELQFKNKFSSDISVLSNKMKDENSICVHIRRGDYMSEEFKFLQVCSENYFQKSIEKMLSLVSNPIFYFFTDDIEWVKNNWYFDINHEYVSPDYSTIDNLYLMSSCKHYIISNSTFSFWGMYLNQNENKYIIAPAYWHADKSKESVYMDSWILVDPEMS